MTTPTQIITTNTYDQRGNLLTDVVEYDYDGDGNIDFRDSQTYTYDQRGNLLTGVVENDYDADGTIDFRQEILYEYLNGSEYVIGVSTGEPEVFADNSIDSQVNPLSEQFNLPLTVSEF